MKLEVFFDYACPYCYEGLEYLRELLPRTHALEPEWFPCEAHPRPERYGIHSDIAMQGFYFAQENGIDAWAYNDRLFKAIFVERSNIEDAKIVAGCLGDLGADANTFLTVFKSGKYADIPAQNNRLAWGVNHLHAVPSYKLNGKILGSRDGMPVSENQLAAFLSL